MTDRFTQRGGAQIGQWIATWPFGVLAADDTSIELSVISKKAFPKADIVRLSPYRNMLGTGLRIEHTVKSETSFIVFWPLDFDGLKANLIRLGYNVMD
ncbi:MAG: hypothetical protein ABL901_11545 [Hyphomicrobiaceae bacterium]